jgi:transposase
VIAAELQCDDQTVRNAIKAFNRAGLASLEAQSRAPHHKPHQGFDEAGVATLKVLIRRSPRHYGNATSVWTLAMLAEVCFAAKVTARLVSRESVRLTLRRAGITWKRAKHWIVSPDPTYDAKKNDGTA